MIPWISSDDSLIRYSLRVSHPNGDVLDQEVLARDSEDAAVKAAEQLLRDWPELGSTTDDVSDRVEVLGRM